MKKVFIFILAIVVTFIVIAIVVGFNLRFNTLTEAVEIVDVDSCSLPVDTITLLDEMPEEEFIREMQKGVQGDFTLEQVDSMQRSWAKQ